MGKYGQAYAEFTAKYDLPLNMQNEYKAAKQYKNKNESRIRYLERMIKTAEVFEETSSEDEVGMNNTVELYFEEVSLKPKANKGQLVSFWHTLLMPAGFSGSAG